MQIVRNYNYTIPLYRNMGFAKTAAPKIQNEEKENSSTTNNHKNSNKYIYAATILAAGLIASVAAIRLIKKRNFIESEQLIVAKNADKFPVEGLRPVKATNNDINEITNLMCDIEINEHNNFYNPDRVKSKLKNNIKNENSMIIAVKNNENKIVATGSMFREDINTLGIYNLYIDKHYREKHIGSWILARFFEKAEESGYKNLYIDTQYPRAKKLYERLGFEVKSTSVTSNGKTQYNMYKTIKP